MFGTPLDRFGSQGLMGEGYCRSYVARAEATNTSLPFNCFATK